MIMKAETPIARKAEEVFRKRINEWLKNNLW